MPIEFIATIDTRAQVTVGELDINRHSLLGAKVALCPRRLCI